MLQELIALRANLDESKTIDQIKIGVVDYLITVARREEKENGFGMIGQRGYPVQK